MARYRKVDVRMWGDERFRRLTPIPPCGQGLWFFLLTNPQTTNIPGLYRAGEAGLAEELGWSLQAFRKAFAEVSRQGMVEADWSARVVLITGAVKYNGPESPNVVRGWRAQWDEIPECQLKHKAFEHLRGYCEALGEAFAEAFREACAKPSPHPLANQDPDPEQEPDQEHEQEQDQSVGLAPSVVRSVPIIPDPEIRQVFEHYLTYHPRAGVDAKLLKLIRDRLSEPGRTVEDLCLAIDGYHVSPHHCGVNDKGTKYQSLGLIFRDAEKVNNGLEYERARGRPVLSAREEKSVQAVRSFVERGMSDG